MTKDGNSQTSWFTRASRRGRFLSAKIGKVPTAFLSFLSRQTVNSSFFWVLMPNCSKPRLKKLSGSISSIFLSSGVGGVIILSCFSLPFSSLQKRSSTTQQKVFVLTKKKLMFQRCLSIMGGAFSKVTLYSFFAFILIILNLFGYCPKLSTPVSVFLTLSAFDNIYLTKRQSFSTSFSSIFFPSIFENWSAMPEHSRIFLCLFRQEMLQLRT